MQISYEESFNMESNECYSNMNPGKGVEKCNLGQKEEKIHKTSKHCLVIPVIMVLALLVLAAGGVAVYTLVKVASLKDEVSSLKSDFESSEVMSKVQLDNVSTSIGELNKTLVTELQNSLDSLVNSLNSSSQTEESETDLAGITSCAALPPSFPSGYYWVRAYNGIAVPVYCDMTRTCGGVTGGWMRVAYLDMTENSHQCPSGLMEAVYLGQRTCVKNSYSGGCTSVFYPTTNITYSKVCGRVTGYQIGSTDAFELGSRGIDADYVDGVSLTHGSSPRQHIWTFAIGIDRNTNPSGHINSYCPCQTNPPHAPPSFVGNDYSCDSGDQAFSGGEGFHPELLWDGTGCHCCGNAPWFYKQLPPSANDDVEMRVCRNSDRSNEDIALHLIEIYIQ